MAPMVEFKKVTELKLHGSNPRLIKNDKFKKLVQSIKDFPEMLEKRPLVVDEDGIILGGNMRFRSCLELKLKEVPVIVAKGWTEEQKRQFVIKDNVSSGEFDFDVLANEWELADLIEWGLDLPLKKEIEEKDLFNIQLPFYQPSEIKPEIFELANIEKTKDLIRQIDNLKIDKNLKEILKIRAAFFTDFDFQKIADYYYKENKNVKEIFKNLGLVILAPKEAIEKGFISLQDEVFEL